MIQIKNIVKTYLSGENQVVALKDVSINFRNSEFVSILGPSGCGKTTMLNIIGGLDKYTSGDLVINGVSTKEFKDRDWDSYRNHSVGFVFQSYNLIPHQTVLQNVELALTLSGVSKSERRARAKQALEQVGLGDQINKKPNAMSGGQMQRVAIARALVNNPDIILADEPTGALDTETSLQVMEILKSVSKERLVVMVTHNPELAEKYSTRIINMLDGKITHDSKPYEDEKYDKAQEKEIKKEEKALALEESSEVKNKKKKTKKPTMSFWTALKLSLKNLFTKKGRTALTSFAGSIGIIGIALILSVSQGMTTYINHVQETTLASYPVTLEATTIDITSLMTSFMNVGKGELTHEKDAVYKDPIIGELVDALSQVQTNKNDLKAFKQHLESEIEKEDSKFSQSVTGIQYTYDMEIPIYTRNPNDNNEVMKADTGELLSEMIVKYFDYKTDPENSNSNQSVSMPTGNSSSNMMSSMMDVDLWQEILPGLEEDTLINDLIFEQYELIDGGSWPNEYDEIVLVVNENNELDDLTLYALGLLSKDEIDNIIESAAKGQTMEKDSKSWSYDEIRSRTFRTILPSDCYQYDEDLGIFIDKTQLASEIYNPLEELYEESSIELKVTGIVREKKDSDASLLSSGIGYTSKLTQYVIDKANSSAVGIAQKNNKYVNILTGQPFKSNTGVLSDQEKALSFRSYLDNLSVKERAQAFISIECLNIDPTLINNRFMSIWVDYNGDIAKQKELIKKVYRENYNQNDSFINSYLDKQEDSEITDMARVICFGMAQAELVEETQTNYLSNYTTEELSDMLTQHMQTATDEKCVLYYDNITNFSDMTYEEVLIQLGCLDLESPMAINLYVSSFEDKDVIIDAIGDYNDNVSEEKRISYTDYLGIMMSSITTIIDAITYVLIAFVSISLIVSSIMIGVITLISVQERTKEIGILRAIGASKRDVSSMFNAETMIIGFASGLFGVVVTYLLCIPINIILYSLTGLANLKAILPIGAALILILISVGLTLISGLIPSRSASKKDPVVALRTE